MGVLLSTADLYGFIQTTSMPDSQRATDTYQIDFSNSLLELGKEFEALNDKEAASFTYRVGRYFCPEHEQLVAPLEFEAATLAAS